MSLTSTLNAALSIVQTSAPDGGSGRITQSVAVSATLANGTLNGQADNAWIDQRTLLTAGTEDLDFAGVLTNALGTVLTMVEITAILIESLAANTTNLTVGGATAEWLGFFAATGDKLVIKPGGLIMAYAPAGWAVTATTADKLMFTNAPGASATYNIAVLGRSA